MKYAEINDRFTKLVENYIRQGYVINTSTMGGSQGEIAKVDLTNGKEIIRIIMDNFYSKQEHGDHYYYDGIEITIRKALDNIVPNSNNTCTVIWNDRCEMLFKEKYYEISRRSGWYGTLDQAQWQKSVHLMRYSLSSVDESVRFGDQAKKIVLPFLRRQPHCKSIKISDIESITKNIKKHSHEKDDVEYRVTAKGRRYMLA